MALPTNKNLHRGAQDDIGRFAPEFVQGRIRGFQKDMAICLTPVDSKDKPGKKTHAYFPALMACCGTLEYLAALHLGRLNPGHREIAAYAEKYLNGSHYTPDIVRVLVCAFRNSVNHRGIASGVWVDKGTLGQERRLTWRLTALTTGPAINVVEETDELRRDSPWPCRYTHRVHIHLGRLWRDIRDSAERYRVDLRASPQLQTNFQKCMKVLYPE